MLLLELPNSIGGKKYVSTDGQVGDYKEERGVRISLDLQTERDADQAQLVTPLGVGDIASDKTSVHSDELRFDGEPQVVHAVRRKPGLARHENLLSDRFVLNY
jgi:hypothetical protein